MAYSTATGTFSGSSNLVAVPFPYVEKSDVTLTVAGVVVPLTDANWNTDSLILAPGAVYPANTPWVVSRSTLVSNPAAVFSGGGVGLATPDLNLNANQAVYLIQELLDALAAAASKEAADIAALQASLLALAQNSSYLYKKAINANPTTSGAGGVDAMLAFCQANNSPGSNAMQAAVLSIATPAGGDFETLVLIPWLTGATNAVPPGLGLSNSSTPALGDLVAALRTAAASSSF